MLLRLGKWLVVMVLTTAIGGHWVILQSIAWISMTVNYSQSSSLKEALVKTFSGRNPCSICKIVSEGRKAEKQQPQQEPVSKLDLLLVVHSVAFLAPKADPASPSLPGIPLDRVESPPSPPPRAA